ncbi:tyrosine-type recombinase/integrase [Cupriavidus sp. D39]|uniref:tyrosine-type recombinase/integrase n=1 Tax=Cupriavidus sp. D39 TaxID=2997877 RepID=UPI0022705432|nr:site-specific integrase [Cupriavidus sp. D39]MCY0854602.1 tyrosine-type recombinase/integrase [Cupriavidus sp. D39]
MIKFAMNNLWLKNPSLAYADWQGRESAGTDQRRFAQQSIVQHRAMLDRFQRHLVAHGVTLEDFDPDHIEAFWRDPEAATYTSATRMRYLQLLDRLCRHLVEIGVRETNPAADPVRDGSWSSDGAVPLFLPEEVDARLQDFVQPLEGDDVSRLRMRAILALFLGAGVTAAEGRSATIHDLQTSCTSSFLSVPEGRAKVARSVQLEPFAVPALDAWKVRRATLPIAGDLLFALRPSGTPITDMSLGNIVRDAFEAIDYRAADMSPRILRNTYCRRALLAGVPRDRVSERLGLTSNHTCDRMLATIPGPADRRLSA